eukprot:COSAG02_NODE_4421_length_5377_cov_4.815839_4_plen_50_part_00
MEQSEAALQPVGASRNWDEDADPNEVRSLVSWPPLVDQIHIENCVCEIA